MLSFLIGWLVLTGAATLGAIEYAMSPHQKRFPCVPRSAIWVLRTYTIFLAFAAFDRLWRVYLGTPLESTIYQLGAAASMAMTHTLLLILVLRQRLPVGTWPRLQARHARVKRLAAMGGAVGSTLAKKAADSDTPVAAPMDVPHDMLPVMERLARLP